jgi:hypothetical protein
MPRGSVRIEPYQRQRQDPTTRSWCHAKEEISAESGFDFFEIQTVGLKETVTVDRSATAFGALALSGRTETAF